MCGRIVLALDELAADEYVQMVSRLLYLWHMILVFSAVV